MTKSVHRIRVSRNTYRHKNTNKCTCTYTKKCPRQPAKPARAIAPTASAPTVSAPRAKTLKRANSHMRALFLRGADNIVACYRARVLVPEKLFFPRCCNTFTLLGIKTHSYRTENAFSLCLFARARFPAKKNPQRTSVLARRALFLPRVVAAVVCASFLDSFRCCCFIFALLLLLYSKRRRRRRGRFFQKSNTRFLLHHILMNAAYGRE